MKISALLLFSFLAFQVNAQVKIGNNPTTINTASLLELESTNKGFLPSRVALTDRLTWAPMTGTAVKGMVVFNTTLGLNSLDTGLVIWEGQWNDFQTSVKSKMWPYHTNDLLLGTNGNAKGIIALPGTGQIASGNYSHTEGVNDTATSEYAWAIGQGNKVAGKYGFASGVNNKIIGGDYNVILAGNGDTVNHSHAGAKGHNLVMGVNNYVVSGAAAGGFNFVNGINNKIDTKGSANIVFSSASVIGFPGANLTGTQPENQNLVLGANDTIFHKGVADASRNILGGSNIKIVGGSRNLVMGSNNIVDSSNGNILAGFNHYVNGFAVNNLVVGNQDSVRNTQGSAAIGGFNVIDSATFSSALGYRLRNNSWVSTVVGSGNAFKPTAKPYGPWNGTDPLFTVGAGQPGVVGGTLVDTVNALLVLKNGWTLVNAGLSKTSVSDPYFAPRAELDVTGTGAIIMPNGTTVQRPATPIAGMTRFNSVFNCMETYDGTAWHGTIIKSESVTLPAIAINAGTTYTFTSFTGVPPAVVAVSPAASLTAGLVVAWTRVNGTGTVLMRIENTGAAFAGGTVTFDLRIMY